ncbi:hypothetical protein Dda_1180 [Drechslerella dactyloides]|uniref:Uncharacterized protein n=1 Tax=Drechslerella dactyloides TaxID=74499 RepID=A0AAD6J679_DREDA|nr:hypothetical protein Dda_1180 [Drechslerella dactyloides]
MTGKPYIRTMNFLRTSIAAARRQTSITYKYGHPRLPRTHRYMSSRVDSSAVSKITQAEKDITGLDGPVAGGPTARAQQHAGEAITAGVLHDITEGEKLVMMDGTGPVKDGPTAVAQSELAKAIREGEIVPPSRGGPPPDSPSPISLSTTYTMTGEHTVRPNTTATIDPPTISRIHDAERKITGEFDTAPGGPTEAAKRHAGERIDRTVVRDVVEGEKMVTGLDHGVKGGPAGVAQSVLTKSRQRS